ncbi:MAG: hypothetical protein SLagBPW_42230 [Shewanella algae]
MPQGHSLKSLSLGIRKSIHTKVSVRPGRRYPVSGVESLAVLQHKHLLVRKYAQAFTLNRTK